MSRDRDPLEKEPHLKDAFKQAHDDKQRGQKPEPPPVPDNIRQHAPGPVLKPSGTMAGLARHAEKTARETVEKERAKRLREQMPERKFEKFQKNKLDITKQNRNRDRGRTRERER